MPFEKHFEVIKKNVIFRGTPKVIWWWNVWFLQQSPNNFCCRESGFCVCLLATMDLFLCLLRKNKTCSNSCQPKNPAGVQWTPVGSNGPHRPFLFCRSQKKTCDVIPFAGDQGQYFWGIPKISGRNVQKWQFYDNFQERGVHWTPENRNRVKYQRYSTDNTEFA